MREIMALLHIKWRTASSYRLQLVLSFANLLVSLVPLYFVGRALNPFMADVIQGEGGEFFGFLVIGTVAVTFVGMAVQSLPNEIGSGLGTGTFESMLATPVRLPVLLAGLTSYDLLWALARGAALLAGGWALGAGVDAAGLGAFLLILVLIVLAYLPIGMLAAALMLLFRTSGELPRVTLYASVLVGGVYYPSSVIPESIRGLSAAMPLTYGLRAARRVVLQGATLADVSSDLLVLGVFALVLGVAGITALQAALRVVRRTGGLAHY
ncbi:MAG TPA: ABC transporter permease [Gemmatimonadaceae bacterium]|nr:ABC transporter permease [Gemmatimonadaceae bacterium]